VEKALVRTAARRRASIDRAIAGSSGRRRLRAGYQAALRALLPSLPDDVLAALCVTEAEGNHPKAVRTTLSADGPAFRLRGEKRWTTLGPDGGLFIVIAREAGSPEDRPSLKAVVLRSGTAGLSVLPMPPTRFVPEVPHARVRSKRTRTRRGAPATPGRYVAVPDGRGYPRATLRPPKRARHLVAEGARAAGRGWRRSTRAPTHNARGRARDRLRPDRGGRAPLGGAG
jgi:hypothetical protein